MNIVRELSICMLSSLIIGCGGSSGNSSNSDATDPDAIESSSVNNSPGDLPGAIARAVAGVPQTLPVSVPFEDTSVTEASGVQRSLSLPGVYYVHNDSGSSAILYVTDASGQSIGRLQLDGVRAIDWEAIAGARFSGQPHVVVADMGNNNRNRSDLKLLVIEEPDFSTLPLNFELAVSSRRVNVSYADGLNYDAESVFIDGDNDTVVVVTKEGADPTAQSIWKGSLTSGLRDGSMVLQYRGLLNLPSLAFVNAATDIDIHPDGRQLAVLVYGSGLAFSGRVYLWQPEVGEGTSDALARAADQVIDVPVIGSNGQAEGISFSADGDALLVAAEGAATSTITIVQY